MAEDMLLYERDGELDQCDGVIPALVRVDGSGYTELSGPVDNVIEASLSDDGRLYSLLVEEGDKLSYRDYDTATFRLRSSQEIAALRVPAN